MVAGVAARIGANIVARLANILDIACIERLAITDSGPQRTCVSFCYGLLAYLILESSPMSSQNPSTWLTGPVVRLGRRVLDGLARRIAERLRAEWNSRQAGRAESNGMMIPVDYPIHPRAR